MATSEHYENTRDDANLLLSKVDALLQSMEHNLVPSMNVTLKSIARQISPPPPRPRKVSQGRIETSTPSAASTGSSNERKVRTSARPAKPAPGEEASSKKRSLNCQDSGVNPRRKTKVGGGNDEGKGNETATSRETNDAESNDATDTLGRTEREEANELASYAMTNSQSCGTHASSEHQPSPVASSLQKCYEDTNHFRASPNIIRGQVWPEGEPDSPEVDDDARSSSYSKKRQRSNSASSSDTPPRKRARTDSGPSAPQVSTASSPSREPRHEAAENDHASGEDGALQASIASEMIREELQKHRDFIDDMHNQVYNALDELKAQKWLLWYRLCCCTVVSSKKYSYRGRVRRMEETQKYDELREVFDEGEKLHGYCSGLVERAKDAVWNASQVMGGDS